jgi:hypothetical protein
VYPERGPGGAESKDELSNAPEMWGSGTKGGICLERHSGMCMPRPEIIVPSSSIIVAECHSRGGLSFSDLEKGGNPVRG